MNGVRGDKSHEIPNLATENHFGHSMEELFALGEMRRRAEKSIVELIECFKILLAHDITATGTGKELSSNIIPDAVVGVS